MLATAIVGALICVMYPWQHARRFNSYPQYFKKTFGERVQKVSIDAGFDCPNRDGTVAYGGCTFCDNDAFNPSYCHPDVSITEQIEVGIRFHRKRYHNPGRHLAYFQAFTNTHAPLDRLKVIYEEALAVPDVIGLVIGTRPDCLDPEKLDYFQKLAETKYVVLEIGIESCYDATLKRVNRGHNYAQAVDAICQAAERGIHVGTHLVFGLPGESETMLLAEAEMLSKLPLNTIKFHQLQLIRGTAMVTDYERHPEDFRFYQLEEYLQFMRRFVERLDPGIVIERFFAEAPPEMDVTPIRWNMRNDQLLQRFERLLELEDTWQGRLCASS
ncbi:TIGR01212 family radical SAM protein [Coraliomargarita sp. W4R53]